MRNNWRDRYVRALTAIAVVGVLYALAGHTPLGKLIYQLPVASGFRAWARTTLLVQLALSALSALGVRNALERPKQAAHWFGGSVAIIGAAALFLTREPSMRSFRASGPFMVLAQLIPIGLILGLLVATLWRQFGTKGAAALFIAVCALDMTSFARFASWSNSNVPTSRVREFFTSNPPAFGMPYQANGGVDRWASDSYAYRSVSLIKSIQGVNAFDPMIQRDWSKIAGGMAYDGFPVRSDFWNGSWINDILRVTTLSLVKEVIPAGTGWKFERNVDNSDMKRWIRTPVLPEAYLVEYMVNGTLDQIQVAISNPDSDFRHAAFVEKAKDVNGAVLPTASIFPLIDRNAPVSDGGAPGTVISSDLSGSPRAVIEVTRQALLVLATSWSAGWSARIDGKRSSVYRTNGIVMGVMVPPGKHEVHLVFDPPGYRIGKLISVLSFFGLFGGPLFIELRRIRQKPKLQLHASEED